MDQEENYSLCGNKSDEPLKAETEEGVCTLYGELPSYSWPLSRAEDYLLGPSRKQEDKYSQGTPPESGLRLAHQMVKMNVGQAEDPARGKVPDRS